MKQEMMKQAAAVLALTASVLFTSCAPESQNSHAAYLDANEIENSNIVGGQLATSNFQKAHGIVQLRMRTLLGGSICTGSLITRDIVLTAAHCVENFGPFKLRVDVIFGLGAKTDAVIAASTWEKHPLYGKAADANGVQNDIALIKLKKPAPADFKLAQLPNAETIKQLVIGSRLTFAGYGITNAMVREYKKDKDGNIIKDKNGRPQTVELPSQGSGTLRLVTGVPVTHVTSDLKEIELDQSNLRGACHGDSGGPALFQLQDGSVIQVGVTSRGTEELGNCNKGVIYSGIAGHHDFIAKTIAKFKAN